MEKIVVTALCLALVLFYLWINLGVARKSLPRVKDINGLPLEIQLSVIASVWARTSYWKLQQYVVLAVVYPVALITFGESGWPFLETCAFVVVITAQAALAWTARNHDRIVGAIRRALEPEVQRELHQRMWAERCAMISGTAST